MSVAGTYTTTVKSPMGDQAGTFTVEDNGDGTFSGNMAGGMGSMDVEEGKVDGNTLTWKMNMTVPMPRLRSNHRRRHADRQCKCRRLRSDAGKRHSRLSDNLNETKRGCLSNPAAPFCCVNANQVRRDYFTCWTVLLSNSDGPANMREK